MGNINTCEREQAQIQELAAEVNRLRGYVSEGQTMGMGTKQGMAVTEQRAMSPVEGRVASMRRPKYAVTHRRRRRTFD